MPQLCMRDLSAKADTSESTSKASGSQLVRHKPRADAGLRWDQGYLYTSKINEGFGSLRQTVPRTDVGTCQGPRWQFHRRGSPWARWAQPPESLLTASQATIPLLLSPNWMVTPEVKGKRGVNEGSGKAPWGAEHRNSPKGELVAAGLGATEQNQEESRVGRAKQNVRQGGEKCEVQEVAWGHAASCAENRVPLKWCQEWRASGRVRGCGGDSSWFAATPWTLRAHSKARLKKPAGEKALNVSIRDGK